MIRPFFAEPCGDRPGWYIVDAENIAYFGDIYLKARCRRGDPGHVRGYRGRPSLARASFYTVKSTSEALSSLGLGGVLITLGYSAGRKTTIDVTDLIWKRARMAGFRLRELQTLGQ